MLTLGRGPAGPRSAAGVPEAGVWEFLLWLVRRRYRLRVRGTSMEPLVEPGDHLLVDGRAYRRRPPAPGEIVAARHPFQADLLIVKQVVAVTETGRLQLAGTGWESTDSRAYGPLPMDRVLGRVTSRVR